MSKREHLNIRRPEELDFEVPEFLAKSINELIDALECDKPDLWKYYDAVHQDGRLLNE